MPIRSGSCLKKQIQRLTSILKIPFPLEKVILSPSAYSLNYNGISIFLTSVLQYIWLVLPLFLHDAVLQKISKKKIFLF